VGRVGVPAEQGRPQNLSATTGQLSVDTSSVDVETALTRALTRALLLVSRYRRRQTISCLIVHMIATPPSPPQQPSSAVNFMHQDAITAASNARVNNTQLCGDMLHLLC